MEGKNLAIENKKKNICLGESNSSIQVKCFIAVKS